ncbi:MAG: FadR family transcriptional regulator [Atopobiaceae bacterium]|nr:FadR family transcriptional regulator [Atopobiaceae bacterium]
MGSKGLLNTLRSRNISEVIIDRIVNSILSGELRPGEKLPPEDEFAERLGVGRSSIREAMKILEAMGIVEIRRADGTYIVDEFTEQMMNPLLLGMLMAEKSSEDICEFKLLIQAIAFKEIARCSGFVPFDSCIALLDEIEQGRATDDEQLCSMLSSVELHLAEGIPNPLIRELYKKSVQIAFYLLLQVLQSAPQQTQLSLTTFYRDAIAALESRDEKLLRELLEHERSLLLSGIK